MHVEVWNRLTSERTILNGDGEAASFMDGFHDGADFLDRAEEVGNLVAAEIRKSLGLGPSGNHQHVSWGDWLEVDDRKAVLSAVKRLVRDIKAREFES